MQIFTSSKNTWVCVRITLIDVTPPPPTPPPQPVGARKIKQGSTSPSVPRPWLAVPMSGQCPPHPTQPPLSVFLWEILWLRARNRLFTLAPPQKGAGGEDIKRSAEKKPLVSASVWLPNYRQTARGTNRKTWCDKTRHQAQFARAHSAERCLTGDIWGAGEPINTSCAPSCLRGRGLSGELSLSSPLHCLWLSQESTFLPLIFTAISAVSLPASLLKLTGEV